jgi:peptidoglycan/xylan/chitin deacetylase (PgdA/CDA1 family)
MRPNRSIRSASVTRLLRHIAKAIPVRGLDRSLLVCLLVLGFCVGASASETDCKGKPDALGVSRIIAVDPTEHPRIGTMQYPETLPLADHEVVLTFDDGPSPRYTDRILEALAAQCVKATFFMVGEMAKMFSDEARKVETEGHTIGTHSFSHPFTFNKMTESQAGEEIDKGVEAVQAALGDQAKLAPFFRVPGFLTSKSTEDALASRHLMTWSTDVTGDDWRPISSAEVARRAMSRLEAQGRGVLLLHDLHERTVAALPELLNELKQEGFKIVQVVPASTTTPKTETTPDQWHLPPPAAVAAESEKPSAAEAPTKSADAIHKTKTSTRLRKGIRKLASVNHYRKSGHIGVRHHANLACRAYNHGKSLTGRCAAVL